MYLGPKSVIPLLVFARWIRRALAALYLLPREAPKLCVGAEQIERAARVWSICKALPDQNVA